MKPDLAYIKDRFRYFNSRIFVSPLPEPKFQISDAATHAGMFVGKYRADGYPATVPPECCIRISRRHDLEPTVLDDVLIHEMIHYWLWYNKKRDTAPHGVLFLRLMNEINRRFSRNITVSHRITAESRDSDRKVKPHYILVTRWKDGFEGLTPMARTRIFDMHDVFLRNPDVVEMKWYFTMDPYFNRFRSFLTPKYYLLSDEMRGKLANATPCTCDGHKFGQKMNE